jgi:hypothetical protein
VHRWVGHNIFECRKAKREKLGEDGKRDGKQGNGNNESSSQDRSQQSYQPSFTYPSYPHSSNTANHIANVTHFIEANTTEISHPDDWIVDSGANAYITPHKTDLYSYVKTKIGQVKGFTGNLTTVVGKGSMTLTDGNGKQLHLNNVCYCPGSQYRILSFMKFRTEFHLSFQFTGWETYTFGASNGFAVHGRSVNNIMHLSLGSQPDSINAVTTRRAATEAQRSSLKRKHNEINEQTPSDLELNDDDDDDLASQPSDTSLQDKPTGLQNKPTGLQSEPSPTATQPTSPLGCSPQNLWHLRFGHAPTTALRKLRLIKSLFDSRTCHPFLRAKKTCRPFRSSESREKEKLGRVHSDVSGPFTESVKNKSIYNLLFLDEATQWLKTYSINDRSSTTVAEKFREYLASVERKTGLKLKRLRVNGGREYKGDLTPECNGKAERMNRTLNSMVRAMVAQANMPNSFWAEAMKTATYLRNRLPTTALKDDIPYERWYGKPLRKQDVKLPKPFGCIVWDEIPEEDRKRKGKRVAKHLDRGTRGCFLGYVSSTTFLYWNFAQKAIVHSVNLTFHETEFP